MKNKLAYILLLAGVLLLTGAGFYAWQSAQSSVNVGVDVPQQVAGLALLKAQGGSAGLTSIKQLHGVDFPLVSAIVAEYGAEATLWVAETASDEQARNLIHSMDASIAQGGSPFTPMGVFEFQKRDVYMLRSEEQMHFYIQSGSKVFWMAGSPEIAEQAMIELLAFYP